MTAEHYMALDDLQTVWTNTIKPYIGEQIAAATGAVAEPSSSATSMWNNYNIR